MKKGYLIPNGVILKEHEQKTVNFLIDRGHIIELVPPKPIEHIKTPDTKIDGDFWEVKSPKNNGKNTIYHMMQAASHQAENLIVDLRWSKAPMRSLSQIKYESKKRSRLKNVIVITNDKKIIYIKGKL